MNEDGGEPAGRPAGDCIIVVVASNDQDSRRLPIPLDTGYTGTIDALVGRGDLDHVVGFRPSLDRLYIIPHGPGCLRNAIVPCC